MIFEYVNPSDIHSIWFAVRNGLDVVLERTNEKWIPEDIYHAIKSNNAQLFLIDNGFLVLKHYKNEFTNESILHIWIAYHKTNEDLAEELHGNLRKIADNVGAKTITFNSPRRWERRSGYKVRSINYELEV